MARDDSEGGMQPTGFVTVSAAAKHFSYSPKKILRTIKGSRVRTIGTGSGLRVDFVDLYRALEGAEKKRGRKS